jgi:hypothetical protein
VPQCLSVSNQGLHLGNAGHVVNEAVVAEEGAAFGEEGVDISRGGDFVEGVLHFPRGHELAFFDVDRFARRSGGKQQVGLPTQERGNLQHIHMMSDRGGLIGFVKIGGDGDGQLFPHRREDLEAFVHADAALGMGAGTIGFVERSFEDVRNAELLRDRLDGGGNLQAGVERLNDAWPGDDEEPLRPGQGGVVREQGLVIGVKRAEGDGVHRCSEGVVSGQKIVGEGEKWEKRGGLWGEGCGVENFGEGLIDVLVGSVELVEAARIKVERVTDGGGDGGAARHALLAVNEEGGDAGMLLEKVTDLGGVGAGHRLGVGRCAGAGARIAVIEGENKDAA